MARTSRTARARANVTALDRLMLDLHGIVQGGTRHDAEAAWALVREELLEAAIIHSRTCKRLHLPEAFWRFEGPEDLRPFELPNGRTAIVGDTLMRRAAWLADHRKELGL